MRKFGSGPVFGLGLGHGKSVPDLGWSVQACMVLGLNGPTRLNLSLFGMLGLGLGGGDLFGLNIFSPGPNSLDVCGLIG